MHAQDVIRPLDRPIKAQGAMAVLYGNLCPRGAVIKQSAASPALLQHTGRAVVFESVEDLAARIDDPALDVEADDVLVLRNAGPRGAPGMPEAGYMPIPRKLAAQRRQGHGAAVRCAHERHRLRHHRAAHVAGGRRRRAAGAGRATATMIRLDVAARRIDVLVDEAELAKRAAVARPPVERPARGYARLYHDHVLQADAGCDFDFLTARPAEQAAEPSNNRLESTQ